MLNHNQNKSVVSDPTKSSHPQPQPQHLPSTAQPQMYHDPHHTYIPQDQVYHQQHFSPPPPPSRPVEQDSIPERQLHNDLATNLFGRDIAVESYPTSSTAHVAPLSQVEDAKKRSKGTDTSIQPHPCHPPSEASTSTSASNTDIHPVDNPPPTQDFHMGDDVYPAASESDSTSTAITVEEKAPDPPIASEYLMVTAPSSSSYIAHFSIPESLRPAFRDVLCNPPDPDLKIKKKSVRFTKSVRR